MKIIKKHYIETWFSPVRYCYQSDSEIKFFLIKDSKHCNRRKIGPAVECNSYKIWINNDFETRIDGPSSICRNNGNLKYWSYKKDYGKNEESYWNH